MTVRKKVALDGALKWARPAVDIPGFFAHPPRLRGIQGAGIRYERKVAAYFAARMESKLVAGPWFEYSDEGGEGWCQPDFLILGPKRKEVYSYVVVGECKLKYKPRAQSKLVDFYGPITQEIFPCKELRLVQVCYHLTPRVKKESLLKEPSELWATKFNHEGPTVLHLRELPL